MHPPEALTVSALAARPRWSPERVLALEGRCRGSVLADWAEHVRRRWGDDALTRVRAGLGSGAGELPDAPEPRCWLPVALQVRATDVVIDTLLGGDALRLAPLVFEDARRSTTRVVGIFLRRFGPASVFRHAARVHRTLYDVGAATSTVRGHAMTMTFRGARLFANPTWQLLQLWGHEGLILISGREAFEVSGQPLGDDGFEISLRWR